MVSMRQNQEGGVTLASKFSYWESARHSTYRDLGTMKTLSKPMESARLFIKGETRHAANIFVSITNFTWRSAKKPRYQSIIGQSNELSGGVCKRIKEPKSKAK